MSSIYYTPLILSELYQIPLSTVWKWIREGQFKGAIKIGKFYRIPHDARIDFEKRHRVA